MATIEQIRAKLLEQEEKKSRSFSGKFGGDNAVYPFWNMDFDESCLIRFLPDGDDSNDFFWVERLMLKFPFKGIKGKSKETVIVQVPCIEMYGKQCPVITEIRPWWKDKDLEDLARTYYKKRNYIFQGFVVRSPFDEEGVESNKLRRFMINSQVFDVIKSSLMDPDMEELPTDINLGRDFKINKTKKGEWAQYTTSSWSMKTRALTDDELGTIADPGLFNLKDFLPKEPTDEGIEIIKKMFEASVAEEPYDPALWADYYRPFGLNDEDIPTKTTVPVTETASTPVEEVETTAPVAKVEVDSTVETGSKVDALAALRARAAETAGGTPAQSSPEDSSTKSGSADEILKIIRERASKQES